MTDYRERVGQGRQTGLTIDELYGTIEGTETPEYYDDDGSIDTQELEEGQETGGESYGGGEDYTDTTDDTTTTTTSGSDPARMIINSVTVDSTPIRALTGATALVRISNTGDQAGEIQKTVRVNGTSIGTVRAELGGGGSTEKSLPFTAPNANSMEITVGNTSYSTDLQPAVNVPSFDMDPRPPIVGREATLNVSFTNEAEQSVTQNYPITIQGETVASPSVSLSPGQTKTVSTTFTVPDVDTLNVDVANLTTQYLPEKVGDTDTSSDPPTDTTTDTTSGQTESGAVGSDETDTTSGDVDTTTDTSGGTQESQDTSGGGGAQAPPQNKKVLLALAGLGAAAYGYSKR